MLYKILIGDDIDRNLPEAIPKFLNQYFHEKEVVCVHCKTKEEIVQIVEECLKARPHKEIVYRGTSGENLEKIPEPESGEFGYDIVITDINFEESGGGREDGIENFRLVNRRFPDVPVILATFYDYGIQKITEAWREGAVLWVAQAKGEEEDRLFKCPTPGCLEKIDPEVFYEATFPTCPKCGMPRRRYWYDFYVAFIKAFRDADKNRVIRRQKKELKESERLPELYEVTIVQKDPASVLAPMKVLVSEKKTNGVEIGFTLGAQSRLLRILAERPCEYIPTEEIVDKLNMVKETMEYTPLSSGFRWDLLDTAGVEPIIQEEGDHFPCDLSDNTLCNFALTGKKPGEGEEGVQCYTKLGYCVKILYKSHRKSRKESNSRTVTNHVRDIRKLIFEAVVPDDNEGCPYGGKPGRRCEWGHLQPCKTICGKYVISQKHGKGYGLAASVRWEVE